MPESLAEKVLAQLAKNTRGRFVVEGTDGGCESCGYGGNYMRCVLCQEEITDAEDSRSDIYNGHETRHLRIKHRDGCSVPLIQAAQHEAGLHKEPR